MLVSELDLECKLWIKLRLAPLPPHVGTISLAFVGQPTVRVQLAPYNRVRLMRIPILQVCTHAGICSTPGLCTAHSADIPALFSFMPITVQSLGLLLVDMHTLVNAAAAALLGHAACCRALLMGGHHIAGIPDSAADGGPAGPHGAALAPGDRHPARAHICGRGGRGT